MLKYKRQYSDEMLYSSLLYEKANFQRVLNYFDMLVFSILYEDDKKFKQLEELEIVRGFLIE